MNGESGIRGTTGRQGRLHAQSQAGAEDARPETLLGRRYMSCVRGIHQHMHRTRYNMRRSMRTQRLFCHGDAFWAQNLAEELDFLTPLRSTSAPSFVSPQRQATAVHQSLFCWAHTLSTNARAFCSPASWARPVIEPCTVRAAAAAAAAAAAVVTRDSDILPACCVARRAAEGRREWQARRQLPCHLGLGRAALRAAAGWLGAGGKAPSCRPAWPELDTEQCDALKGVALG